MKEDYLTTNKIKKTENSSYNYINISEAKPFLNSLKELKK